MTDGRQPRARHIGGQCSGRNAVVLLCSLALSPAAVAGVTPGEPVPESGQLSGQVAANREAEGGLMAALILNRTEFYPGAVLHVAVAISSHEPDFVTDVYFGLISPDGRTVTFLTRRSPPHFFTTTLDAGTETFRPLMTRRVIAEGFKLNDDQFFSFAVPRDFGPGGYKLFLAFVSPGSLSDGTLDAMDIKKLVIREFTVLR